VENIETIENCLGQKTLIRMISMQLELSEKEM
jgi:hypothetical protein